MPCCIESFAAIDSNQTSTTTQQQHIHTPKSRAFYIIKSIVTLDAGRRPETETSDDDAKKPHATYSLFAMPNRIVSSHNYGERIETKT